MRNHRTNKNERKLRERDNRRVDISQLKNQNAKTLFYYLTGNNRVGRKNKKDLISFRRRIITIIFRRYISGELKISFIIQ